MFDVMQFDQEGDFQWCGLILKVTYQGQKISKRAAAVNFLSVVYFKNCEQYFCQCFTLPFSRFQNGTIPQLIPNHAVFSQENTTIFAVSSYKKILQIIKVDVSVTDEDEMPDDFSGFIVLDGDDSEAEAEIDDAEDMVVSPRTLSVD